MLQDTMPIIVDLPLEDTTLIPIGDCHVGDRQFMEKEFVSFLDSIKGTKKKILITGDCMNNAIKSSVSNIYEETMSPSAQKEWLYEHLEPIKDQIIAGVGGNHSRRSMREVDDNPLYDVFCRMKIEHRYRERMAFIIVRLGRDQKGKAHRTPTYGICLTHGAGGGLYVGSSSAKAERFGMALEGIDILCMGHTHRAVEYDVGKICLDSQNHKVTQKQFTVVVATSWLRAGGYGLEKLYPPTAFTPQEIILSAKDKRVMILHG